MPKKEDPLFREDDLPELSPELRKAIMEAKRAPTGRPSKMTIRRVRLLLAGIRTTARFKACAALAGIDYATFTRWMKEGEREDAPLHFRMFRAEVTRAREDAEARLTRIVELHAPKDWRAAMALLEARRPKGYAPKVRANVKHEGSLSVKGLAEAFAEFMDDDAKPTKTKGTG
jgi:hypothetical protein